MLTPWKESYDQPRSHVQKQRHYFANKGPSSQGYGFSCGHVWIWELDCEERRASKNWCFWSAVLEKTLESPLDCKEIPSVQFSSVTQSCPTLCDPMNHSTPGLPVHHQLPELIQTHVHWVGDAIQPSHPLSSPSPPAFIHSQHQGLFKWVSSSHQMAKVLEFQLQHQSFRWIFRTDFLRLDWLYLPEGQGTLKSILQHRTSKASILRCSLLFIVQLSHPYMPTRKTIALTRWTFVGKVMSLLFNILSRFVITFLPRSKSLLISWLQSPSAVILELPKIKSVTVSIVSPSISHEVMGPDAMILVFWMLSFKATFSLSSRGFLVLCFLP